MEQKIEGIVLARKLHRDDDALVTLFSKDQGIVTAYARKGSSPQSRLFEATTPLTEVEWVYNRGKGNLLLLQEASIVQYRAHLRLKEASFQCALDCCQALQQTLWQGQTIPSIYDLFRFYLDALQYLPENLSLAENCARNIKWSFWLKLLQYEGRISLKNQCHDCLKLFSEDKLVLWWDGGFVCPEHFLTFVQQQVAENPYICSAKEKNTILALGHSSSLEELFYLEISSELERKLKEIWKQVLEWQENK